MSTEEFFAGWPPGPAPDELVVSVLEEHAHRTLGRMWGKPFAQCKCGEYFDAALTSQAIDAHTAHVAERIIDALGIEQELWISPVSDQPEVDHRWWTYSLEEGPPKAGAVPVYRLKALEP